MLSLNEIEIGKIIIIAFILIGALLSLVTSIGLIRLPDLYTRTHAASKSATLGVLLILLGVFFHFYMENGHMNGRLLLAIVFVFITGPVAGHLIGRAAYNTNVPLWRKSVYNDLNKDKTENKANIE